MSLGEMTVDLGEMTVDLGEVTVDLGEIRFVTLGQLSRSGSSHAWAALTLDLRIPLTEMSSFRPQK